MRFGNMPYQHSSTFTTGANDPVIGAQRHFNDNIQHCYDTMPNMPTHLVVKRMNSRAAAHIELGQHDRAVPLLVKALRLWDAVDEQSSTITSVSNTNSSPGCNMDECIEASFRQRQTQHQSTSLAKGRFVYSQPITISSAEKSCFEGGRSKKTISLILILNLAIAHHLSALKQDCYWMRRRQLHKGLQLYELSHQIQKEQGVFSPQATMIIANNVGEIHRSCDDYEKHTTCLQHLLSTIMYMVDNQSTRSSRIGGQVSSAWDGFLRNTSQLILKDHCAAAAWVESYSWRCNL